MAMMGVTAVAGSSDIVAVAGFNVSDTVAIGGRDTFAHVLFRSDSTTDADDGASGVVQQNAGTDWKDNAGDESLFEVMATVSVGPNPNWAGSAALGTWISSHLGPGWGNDRVQADGIGSFATTLSIQVREKLDVANTDTGSHVLTAGLI